MAKLTPQSVVADESQDGNGTAVGALRQAQGELRSEGKGQMAVRPAAAESSKLVRGNERPTDVVAFERAVVGFFVEAADLLGVPKSVGAIYGICFASPEPLGFSEINERLDISSGSVSQGLKVLRDVGALKVVPPSHFHSHSHSHSHSPAKREFYEPDMELRKLALHFIEERLEKQLEAGKGRLEAIQAAVPTGNNGAARELKSRIKALQSWNNKGRSLVPVMKTFLKLT